MSLQSIEEIEGGSYVIIVAPFFFFQMENDTLVASIDHGLPPFGGMRFVVARNGNRPIKGDLSADLSLGVYFSPVAERTESGRVVVHHLKQRLPDPFNNGDGSAV